MKRSTQLKLTQWGVITGAWLMVGVGMSLYDHLVLLTANSQGLSPHYSLGWSMGFNLLSALTGALLGGSFLVFFVNVRYQDKPYGYTVLAVSLSFVLVIALIVALLGAVAVPLRTGRPLWDPVAREALGRFLLDSARIKNILVWSMVVAFTQVFLQLSNKLGSGGFGHMLRGKYNTPQQEHRIFMFLDLDASTTIAEQLGDEKYHALLKDFFADITPPLIDNQGEIYQYVGDQVVVAWQQQAGIENSQCVRCFFAIKQRIEEKKEHYLHRYGLVPSFKAGIHCGKVIAGEVGTLKRDITYSGDVLNTTSRILSTSKAVGAELTASAELIATLNLLNQYLVQPLGSIKLKGKSKEMQLSTLSLL